MTQNWLTDERFDCINLFCVSITILLLCFFPDLGGVPLLIFCFPWAMYLAFNKKSPLQQTPLDLFLLLFLVTAVVGMWAAYNTQGAWKILWLMLGAILFFYALNTKSNASPQILVFFVVCWAVIVSGYFLLTHNWVDVPASVTPLNHIAAKWMDIRPTFHNKIDPNAAEGVMVILFPFLIVQCLWAIKKRKRAWVGFSIIAILFVLIGLLFATSRGAVLALLMGLAFWAMQGIKNRVGQHFSRREMFFSLVLIGGLFLLAFLFKWDDTRSTFNWILNSETVSSRVELGVNSLDLIEDYPFTGGGLGSFSGLYSHYILVIPYHFSAHSHNIFLDIAVQQGVGGLVALIGILGITAALLLMPPQTTKYDYKELSLLKGALAASLIAFIIHSLIDDPIYASKGVIFLFFLSGVTVKWFGTGMKRLDYLHNKWAYGLLGFVGLLLLLSVAIYNPFSAKWLANLGAVEMAKVELAAWPTNEWADGRSVVYLNSVEEKFELALTYHPGNRTAYHRLGNIEMLRHQYDDAVSYLEKAYTLDPNHRGIGKSLGYSYGWANEVDSALAILIGFPEVKAELDAYVWWWEMQGRDDFVVQADVMLAELEKLTSQ